MTLIDKAEALLPCPFCGGEAEWKSGGPGCAWISCKSCPAETSDGSIPRIMEAWNRRAALPARWVGVKPLVWEESVKGRWIGTPVVKLGDLAFWIFQVDGGFRRAAQDGWQYHLTLEAAKAAAQADYEARIRAALAPTDAAQAREEVLSVAQAAQVLLDAMTARPPLADPFDACDVEVERLAIEYSGQGGDAVIVLETAEKFMLAGLRALIGEPRT